MTIAKSFSDIIYVASEADNANFKQEQNKNQAWFQQGNIIDNILGIVSL